MRTKLLWIGVILAVLLVGCAKRAGPRDRSKSYPLAKENHIRKIAVIGEARVVWPKMGGKQLALCVAESKTSLELLLPQNEAALRDKGYSVTFCKPAGIGPYKAHSGKRKVVVYENFLEEGEKSNQPQVEEGELIYQFPVSDDNLELRNAVHNLVTDYVIHRSDLAIINKYTQADTVCVQRIRGEKYSSRRKAGACIANIAEMGAALCLLPFMIILPPMHTVPKDSVSSTFTFIDVKHGKVLFSYRTWTKGDPIDPPEDIMIKQLKRFPEKNKLLEGQS